MPKAKSKKEKGGLFSAIAVTINGWKKIGKYVASGKWADELSAIAHGGSGASGRARRRAMDRAREAEGKNAMSAAEKQRSAEIVEKSKQGQPLAKKEKSDARAIVDFYKNDSALGSLINEKSSEIGMALTGIEPSAVAKVKAATAKVPTKVQVKAHDRQGTKGVTTHQKTVSKTDRKKTIATELLKSDFSTPMPTSKKQWKAK